MLTNEAFNALLKTLEEPPGHVVFVLATTEPHKVPLTILSRCQRFDFRPIPEELIAKRLEQVVARSNFDVDGEAVQAITRAAGGSMRDALSVLDQALLLSGETAVTADTVHSILGTVAEDVLFGLATGLAVKKAAGVLRQVAEIVAAGKDLQQLVKELTEYLRRLLVVFLAPEGTGEAGFNMPPAELLQLFTRDRLIRAIDHLVEAEQVMRRSVHPRVVLELALVRVMDDDPPPVDELLHRIERLEKALANGEHRGMCEGQSYSNNEPVKDISAVQSNNQPPLKSTTVNAKVQAGFQIDGKQPKMGNTKANPTASPVCGASDDTATDSQVFQKINNNSPVPGPETSHANDTELVHVPAGESNGSELQAIKTAPLKNTGIIMAEDPVQRKTGKNDTQDDPRYSIDQINKWWPEIMAVVKKPTRLPIPVYARYGLRK